MRWKKANRFVTYFIKFEKSCNTTSEYKDELIKQAKKYRNFEPGKNKSD